MIGSREGVPVLAAIRPAGRPQGVWALPKGAVDAGETPEEAALREVREETGLECRVVRPLPELRYFYTRAGNRIAKRVEFWLMEPVAGEIDVIDAVMRREVDEARWLPLRDATRLLSYDGERRMLAALLEVAGP